jgi:hypothetical protein
MSLLSPWVLSARKMLGTASWARAPLWDNTDQSVRYMIDALQSRGSQMAKTPLEIASLARMHTKKAVKTLAAIMNEPHAPYAARVAGAEDG